MPIDLSAVKTIVVVMMENRSFDHLLGYLSLDPHNWNKVEGLNKSSAWQDKIASVYNRTKYRPFLLTDPYDVIDADPPHERDPIEIQMGTAVGGTFPMDGFVTNYAQAKGAKSLTPNSQPPVMGYFAADQAPVTDFFAQNFAICDHWFSCLPAGTQPNRLMAMSGFTNIDVNQVPLPHQELIYDWLTRNGIRWRVYHEEMPFFAMMPNWIPDILKEDRFRPFARLLNDAENDPPDEFPQVIFIEPAYTDAPHLGLCSDDHAPSAIKGGQAFLLEVYRCLTQYPDIWKGTVMIVTYDEHGGFFDHVSPPFLRTDPPVGAHYKRPFETLGIRVPAFVISPFVKPKTVFNDRLDHTSILKFIGKKFGKAGSYSDIVDKRAVGSVLDVLNVPNADRTAPAIPSLIPYLQKQPPKAGFVPGTAPDTPIQKCFQNALDNIRSHPDKPVGKFDALLAAFPPRPHLAQP
jgi:phospholipase C